MNLNKSFLLFYSLIAIPLLLLHLGCNKENPVEVDEEFTGITETGPFSPEPIGNIDPDDWLTEFKYSPNDSTQPVVVLSVEPAYPNPTQRYTTLNFILPTRDSVIIWLEDKPEGKNTTILSSFLLAGQYQLHIDLYYGNDSYNRKEGLIRLHFEVPTRKVIPKIHGDIEYKKP